MGSAAGTHCAGNFGALDPPWDAYDLARFAVLPLPYERTVTFQTGSDRGPEAVIRSTANMELFDEEVDLETYKWGIATLAPIVADEDPAAFADRVETAYYRLLDDEKFVIALGGEHSVSLGPIRAQARRHPGLSILQIDAHADLRDEWEGTHYGHGCVMRRAMDHAPVVQVGIRSISSEERDIVDRGRVRTFFAHECHRGFDRVVRDALGALSDTVYVTVDMDGFDPSMVPGTGTPEPGGLSWWQVNDLLTEVFSLKRVVGADVVEVMPLAGSAVSEYIAARLTYRMMGLAARHGRVGGQPKYNLTGGVDAEGE